MGLRESVMKRADERYLNNSYVSERIDKELGFFHEMNMTKELETCIDIRKRIDGNLIFNQSGFLTFYLLGFDFINPMPAHYYNPRTKAILFEDSVNYGVDLEEKEGWIRDGFNLSADYFISLGKPLKLWTEIKSDEKDKVVRFLKEDYKPEYGIATRRVDEGKFDLLKEEFCDQIKLDHLVIDFPASALYLSDFNGDVPLDAEAFKNYTFGPYASKTFGAKEKATGDLYFTTYSEFIVACGDAFALKQGERSVDLDLNHEPMPTTKEDVFDYFRSNGYDDKKSAQMAGSMWKKEKPAFDCHDPQMKEYLLSLTYYRTKASLVRRNVASYLHDKCEGEKLRRAEEELFREWKGKYELFVPDGLVDPLAYASSPLKITFVLKEVNDEGASDLTDFLREGAVWTTWNNVARWSAGLLFNKTFDEVKDLNGDDRKHHLAPLSVLNLKKTPGGSTSDPAELDAFAKEDSAFIRRQLAIYKPDMIICCGTGTIFVNEVLDKSYKSWIKLSDDLWYMWDEGRLIISTWHTQPRNKSKEYLFKQVPEAINQILYRTSLFLEDLNSRQFEENLKKERALKEKIK